MANERFLPTHNPNIQSLLSGHTFYFATLWRIVRADPSLPVLRYTDHNESLTFDDEVYTPAGGFDASARQAQEGLRENNLSIRGIITDDGITDDDLRAGRFREAEITEMVVDWRFPWAGEIMVSKYWIRETEFSDERWKAEITSVASWLRYRIGRIYTKKCRWRLGQTNVDGAGCGHSDGVDLDAITLTNRQVTEVVVARKVFKTDIPTSGHPDNWWRYGLLTWTSGLNKGIEVEIRHSEQTDGKIWLELRMPFDIQVGDQFKIYPGCDKTLDGANGCGPKFNNKINFGGFPWIPGTDKVMRTIVAPSN